MISSVSQQTLSVMDSLRIFQLRGHTVILDNDLALLYGVETGQFNWAMKRNSARFPADFAFPTLQGRVGLFKMTNGALKTAGRGQHRKYLPQVFTEHGPIMAATLLASEI